MNEELFRGVAALAWRVAVANLGEFLHSDPRREAMLKARVEAFSARMHGGFAAPPSPPAGARESFQSRLNSPAGGIALLLRSQAVPRTYQFVAPAELRELSKADRAALAADRGTCLGIEFLGARVFDLRGLPPEDAATLYGKKPELTDAEHRSFYARPVRLPGTPPPEAVDRKIIEGKRQSLLQLLRDGELLGTGVADDEREEIAADDWREEVASLSEAFSAARLGRWRDVLVRSPRLEALRPDAPRGGRPETVNKEALKVALRMLRRYAPDMTVNQQNVELRQQYPETFGKVSKEHFAKVAAEVRKEIDGNPPATGHEGKG